MKNEPNVILVSLPPNRFNPDFKKRIEEAAAGREVIYTLDRKEAEKYLDRTEIMIGFGFWSLCKKMPRLKWIQSWGAGVDGLINNPELIELPVQITNTRGIHGDQLIEHIFALILSYCRQFPRIYEAQKKHEWLNITDADVPVICGKTMLILGYGTIGEKCAKTALSFGMKVIGVKRRQTEAKPGIRMETAIRIETVDKIQDLLREADYVVNILPGTRDTINFMGMDKFDAMKKSAIYVNVGRGITTDHNALAAALRSGKIGAALLDVTDPEPLPKDSPLWEMENVLITPHYAGMRPDYAELAMEITLKNLDLYGRGETLYNLVDKRAGY